MQQLKPTGVQGDGREDGLMKRADAGDGCGSKNQHPWSGRARKSHVELSPTDWQDWKARPGPMKQQEGLDESTPSVWTGHFASGQETASLSLAHDAFSSPGESRVDAWDRRRRQHVAD